MGGILQTARFALKRLGTNRAALFLFLLLGLTFVRGTVYGSVVPPWQTPDEPKHYEYVALLQQKGRLVDREDASPALQNEIVASMKANNFWEYGYANQPEAVSSTFADIWKMSATQLHRPPLYYLVAAILPGVTGGLGIELQLYLLRLLSASLGVLTVLMVYLTVRTLFPKDFLLALLASSFVAFLPMFSFISGSVNSDNLANLLPAVLAYVLARIFMGGVSVAPVAAVAALLAASVFTKRTTLFALPISALSVAVYLRGSAAYKSVWVSRGAPAALAGIVALMLILERPRQWLWQAADTYLFNHSAEVDIGHYFDKSYGLGDLLGLYAGFLSKMFDSFWAQFGWMNVRLDAWWYYAVLGLSVASIAGLFKVAREIVRGEDCLSEDQKKVILVYAVWIVLVVATPIIQYTADFNPTSFPQGRYIFPALAPIAVFFALGIKKLFPLRVQSSAVFGVIAGLFLFDSLSWLLYLLPHYYQPL